MHRKLLALLFSLFLLGCRGGSTPEVAPWIGKPFPSFTLASARDGDSLRSSQLKGNVSLVTFWATWCPSCLQEIPNLKGIHKTYSPKGLRIFALSVDEHPEAVLP
ncbi:MAG TPA: TlpA disulfide reductase family protein, partial [Fibrobacteria bacterium]|nr:TlpA disulfide reductase family protein [Fibrobacteria bacterium]